MPPPRRQQKNNISRLVVVNLFSMVVLSAAFFIILYLFSFVQNKVNTKIVESAQRSAKSYEIGKAFSRLELDIHNVVTLSSHDSERLLEGRKNILSLFDEILTEVQTTDNYFRRATGLVSLLKYREALALELDDIVLVSRTLLDLEKHSSENLRLFSEMEELVGEIIIDAAVAGQDPSVYHQFSSIIPYCRELVLQARYLVHRAANLQDAGLLLSDGISDDTQNISIIHEKLVRTLYSMTSASPPIARKFVFLLDRVVEYKQQVDYLGEIVQTRKLHHDETEEMVGLVANFLTRVERQTTVNMKTAVAAGNNSINQARYVVYIVSIIVMCVAIFGAFIVYRIARHMAETTQYALHSQEKLAKNIIDLDIEIKRREKAEDSLKNLNMELEDRVVERTNLLQAANKELDSFAYSVSHDLRAPLRSIGGFSQVLEDDYSSVLTGDGLTYLARIKNGCQRMGTLIDNILQLSRLTRNALNKSEVDLSKIATEIAAEFTDSETSRIVEWLIEPGLVVKVDPVMIRVVMTNLIGNAIKYSKNINPARIEFGHKLEGTKQVFFVKDNGAGFDMRYADKLFTAFQRLHSARDFEGDGIGLATVQRIINRHGGKIWGEGKEGEGACFYFIV